MPRPSLRHARVLLAVVCVPALTAQVSPRPGGQPDPQPGSPSASTDAAKGNAALLYRNAWQCLREDLVDGAGERLELPEDGAEDDLWQPLLAPSAIALAIFFEATAIPDCTFSRSDDGLMSEVAENIVVAQDLVRLAGAHARAGRIPPLRAARAQFAFARHVATCGDGLSASLSTMFEREALRSVRTAIEAGAAADQKRELLAEHRKARRTFAQWMPVLRERLYLDLRHVLAELETTRGAAFEPAFTREVREEAIRFADGFFAVADDAPSTQAIVTRSQEFLQAYKADWKDKAGDLSVSRVLETASPGTLLAQTLILMLTPDPSGLAESDAEVARELAACERAVSEGDR